MKANQRTLGRMDEDEEAVSPVIAVILMVAITVVLAATVYIWVTSFSGSSNKPVTASASVQTYDNNTNNKNDGISVTISQLESAIPWGQVTITRNGTVMGSSGGALTHQVFELSKGRSNAPIIVGATSASTGDWANGETLYMRCDTVGGPAVQQELIITLRGNVVHTQTVSCDETGN